MRRTSQCNANPVEIPPLATFRSSQMIAAAKLPGPGPTLCYRVLSVECRSLRLLIITITALIEVVCQHERECAAVVAVFILYICRRKPKCGNGLFPFRASRILNTGERCVPKFYRKFEISLLLPAMPARKFVVPGTVEAMLHSRERLAAKTRAADQQQSSLLAEGKHHRPPGCFPDGKCLCRINAWLQPHIAYSREFSVRARLLSR